MIEIEKVRVYAKLEIGDNTRGNTTLYLVIFNGG
jgi:hypothetical protein